MFAVFISNGILIYLRLIATYLPYELLLILVIDILKIFLNLLYQVIYNSIIILNNSIFFIKHHEKLQASKLFNKRK